MRLILALAAGALGYFYYRGRRATLSRASTAEALQRWDDEGGNAAMRAAGAVPADPRPYPSADPAVRH